MITNLKSSVELVQETPIMVANPTGASDNIISYLPWKPEKFILKALLIKNIHSLVLLFTIISSCGILRAQGFDNTLTNFTSITNYTDINTNNFVVTNAGSDFANYHLSTLKLGTELAEFAKGDANPYHLGTTPTTILGKFTAYRVEYTEPITFKSSFFRTATTQLRAIIVRANNTPTDGSAPCILLTTGVNGTIEDYPSGHIVNISDLLMRGYVVMFYESLGSGRKIKHTNLCGKDRDSIPISLATALIKTPCSKDPNYTQQLLFLNGEAAAKYVSSTVGVSTFKIDKTKIITYGFSLGAGLSSVLLLGKRSDFSATIKSGYGISPNDQFTRLDVQNTAFSIRGGVILGASFFKLNEGMTDLIDITDAQKRWLSIYGKDDSSPAKPENGSDEYDGRVALSSRLSAVNVKHFIASICGAGHTLYGPSMSTEDFFKTDAMKNLLVVVDSANSAALFGIISDDSTLTETLNNFKKINTQSYQVASTACQFIENTLTGSPTVMGTASTVEHVKCLGAASFGNEMSWIFHQFQSNCADIVPQ